MKTMRGLAPPRSEGRSVDAEAPVAEAAAPEPPIVEAPRFGAVEKLGARPLFFC